MKCHHVLKYRATAVATVQIFAEGVSPRADEVCAWCADRFKQVAAGVPPGVRILVELIPLEGWQAASPAQEST